VGASLISSLVVTSPNGLEFIEDTVILVQVAQLAAQVVVDRDGLDRLAVHVDVPDLE
jgi:hypothetical protein